ncbi:hypothetical protein [Halomicrobium sp. LC1Hm]|uniref:hypothetical protein n=1 Tax=Halomicrobium sp. LC1Hm TaxID=2610902 RepID=UPI0012983ABA|nr:hypothetical protein [Halomicrobium sp. LC1Hm]QGA83957.1 hypothetical protein LC1Hm_2925 [Halomicrobium sp. LC1Hm]
MGGRTRASAVAAIGLVVAALGLWNYAARINDWWLFMVQSGLALSVVGTIALLERHHGAWDTRQLILACSLPGVVTTLVFTALRATGTPLYDTYPMPSSPGFEFVWLSTAFLVPLQYALARTRRTSVQWSIAGLTSASVVAVSIDSVAGVQPALYNRMFAPFVLVLALACWIALPAYELGRAVARHHERVAVARRAPAVLGIVTVLVLLVMGSTTAVRPDDPGSLALAIILYGPILILVGRGVTAVDPFARRT